MRAEKEEEFFVIKERCKKCEGRICEKCIPLANRINFSGDPVNMVCSGCRKVMIVVKKIQVEKQTVGYKEMERIHLN